MEIINETFMHESYAIEEIFDYFGYKCIVVLQRLGHRCGYVGVPSTHPLFGVDYMDTYGKSNDIFVHGGLTYSGGEGYPLKEENLWWFGFDCIHSGDAPDIESAEQTFDLNRYDRVYFDNIGRYGEVRDKEYVINELKSLAEQLHDIEVKGAK